MDSIRTMKTDVSDVVARSMANAFGVMFHRDVAAQGTGEGLAKGTGQDICSRASLWQDGLVNMQFSFRFNRDMLAAIAQDAYPASGHDAQVLCEDIACAVANIVVSNVKTYLNGRGYELEMDIPATEAGTPEGGQGHLTHMRFRCDSRGQWEDGILVNMQMQGPRGPKAG